MKNQENRDVFKRNVGYFIEKLVDLEEQKHEIQLDIADNYRKIIKEGHDIIQIKKIVKERRAKKRKDELRLTKDNSFVQLLADMHFHC
jgi:uncharacterized protein (UPF0335 family)